MAGLNQKLGSITHLGGSGIPVLNTKVGEHLQANTVQLNGLGSVREKISRSEDDVRRFITLNPLTGVESIYDLTPTEVSALWYHVEELWGRFVILKRMEAGDDKKALYPRPGGA